MMRSITNRIRNYSPLPIVRYLSSVAISNWMDLDIYVKHSGPLNCQPLDARGLSVHRSDSALLAPGFEENNLKHCVFWCISKDKVDR